MRASLPFALCLTIAAAACGDGRRTADSAGATSGASAARATPTFAPSDTGTPRAGATTAVAPAAPGAPAPSAPRLASPATVAPAVPGVAPGAPQTNVPATAPVASAPVAPPARADSAVAAAAGAAPRNEAAPTPAPAPQPAVAPAVLRALPFGVGEKLEYQVKYGPLGVGRATMEVAGTEEVRGTTTLHTLFQVRGGIAIYSVNDRYESWIDPRTVSSLRYVAKIDEGSYERERRFEIFPERRVYTENGGAEQPSVSAPLDDGSFVYFVRDFLQQNDVEVGKEYSFDRYFRPDRNPVRLRILRKERVKVPNGTFQTIVVQPIIKTTGIFGEGGHAQIWFTDDSTRTMVQMKSQLKFGSLSLYLTKRTPPR